MSIGSCEAAKALEARLCKWAWAELPARPAKGAWFTVKNVEKYVDMKRMLYYNI